MFKFPFLLCNKWNVENFRNHNKKKRKVKKTYEKVKILNGFKKKWFQLSPKYAWANEILLFPLNEGQINYETFIPPDSTQMMRLNCPPYSPFHILMYIHKNTIFILIYCLLSKNRKENVVIHRYNTGNGKTLWLWMNKRWLTIIIYAVACNFFLFMYKFAYVRTNSVYKWIINEDLNQPSQGW